MKLFGTDGIRGVPNRFPLDIETLVRLGRAIAKCMTADPSQGRVCIARDTRHSGPFMMAAVSAGLMAEGVEVIDFGVLPTPGCAALLSQYQADAGVVISASHNPAEDNGVKVFTREGTKLSDQMEARIESAISAMASDANQITLPSDLKTIVPGACHDGAEAQERYLDFLAGTVPGLSLDGLRLVVDCSNGATTNTGPAIFERLSAQVDIIHNHPDGQNINAGCGSEHLESAMARVKECQADIGIVFDGDGDRVLFIDDQGNAVDGDHIMALLAVALKERGELPGDALVCTDYSNKGLDIALAPHGVQVLRGGVGDREVACAMRELGHALGGEQSGHILLTQHLPTGDGILTALQVLRVMQARGKSIRKLAALMQPLPQILLNLDVTDKPPLDKMPKTRDTVQKAEAALAGEGRVYIRYSGTQNMLRVMVEGKDKEAIKTIAENIGHIAQEEISSMAAAF